MTRRESALTRRVACRYPDADVDAGGRGVSIGGWPTSPRPARNYEELCSREPAAPSARALRISSTDGCASRIVDARFTTILSSAEADVASAAWPEHEPRWLTGVAKTALGVARARESSRPDRLFNNPHAQAFLRIPDSW